MQQKYTDYTTAPRIQDFIHGGSNSPKNKQPCSTTFETQKSRKVAFEAESSRTCWNNEKYKQLISNFEVQITSVAMQLEAQPKNGVSCVPFILFIRFARDDFKNSVKNLGLIFIFSKSPSKTYDY